MKLGDPGLETRELFITEQGGGRRRWRCCTALGCYRIRGNPMFLLGRPSLPQLGKLRPRKPCELARVLGLMKALIPAFRFLLGDLG